MLWSLLPRSSTSDGALRSEAETNVACRELSVSSLQSEKVAETPALDWIVTTAAAAAVDVDVAGRAISTVASSSSGGGGGGGGGGHSMPTRRLLLPAAG
jgi:hypothetical protein|eukprot:COSAG06_NODE_15085_length_1098_cov_1.785786_2_plen_99_part_00